MAEPEPERQRLVVSGERPLIGVLEGDDTVRYFTYAVMARYADLRREMRAPGGPGLIGDIDTIIAATALQHRLTVVTTDGDLARVPSLSVRLIPRGSLRSP